MPVRRSNPLTATTQGAYFNKFLDGVPVPGKGATLISDYLAEVEEKSVGVMLFISGKNISGLEVYSMAGHDSSFGLPRIESLYSWEELRNHPIKP